MNDSEKSTEPYNCIVVLGATTTGKTKFAVRLAEQLNGEIISADSRQVYRGMDIGTGKDLQEYGSIPYHLIDIEDPQNEYSVFQFQQDAYQCFKDIQSRNRWAIIAGGTGLYLDAFIHTYNFVPVPKNEALRLELKQAKIEKLHEQLRAYKKNLHNTSDLTDRKRLIRAIEIAEYIQTHPKKVAEHKRKQPNIRPLIFGLRYKRPELRARIATRLDARLKAGLIEEVKTLHNAGISQERLLRFGLEYRYTTEYLQNKYDSKTAYRNALYHAICQFAKRQETWFRRMERNGTTILWRKY